LGDEGSEFCGLGVADEHAVEDEGYGEGEFDFE